jgi:hypothetical protein
MSAALERVAAVFVTPAAAEDRGQPAAPAARWTPRAAVLGAPGEAPPVAAVLAGALRARCGAPAAAVALWAPRTATGGNDRPLVAGPATPAASRLAGRLCECGLPAVPRGRLAWLALPDDAPAAAGTARSAAAALEPPLVLSLSGPRTDPLEEVLREQDLLVVVTREPDGPLARAAIAAAPVPAVATRPLPGPARLLALAGLTGARAPAEPLRAALKGTASGLEPAATSDEAPAWSPFAVSRGDW